jgi:hypothetical protein
MTPERLAEIKAAAEWATPGEWWPVPYDGEGYQVDTKVGCVADCGESFRPEMDARFIALARTAIPELVAEVARLQKSYGFLRSTLAMEERVCDDKKARLARAVGALRKIKGAGKGFSRETAAEALRELGEEV